MREVFKKMFRFFTHVAESSSQKLLQESQMQNSPISVVYPLDSDIRIVQIAPWADPSKQPLLLHAGVVCNLGEDVHVALNGVTDRSPHTRQFLTTVNNDLTEPVLSYLAEEFNCPTYRSQTSPELRARVDQIRKDAEETHDIDTPPYFDPPSLN
jgi:hypothetical protein